MGPTLVVSLSHENTILTIGAQFGEIHSLVARDPLKLLRQIHYFSERKQVICRGDFACAR